MTMVLISDYVAGIAGGIAVVLVGHPFDTTKTRLQTAPHGFYKNTLDCVKITVRNEGFRGFYAGMLSPLAGQMFFRSASFATFFHTAGYFTSRSPNNQISQPELMMSGAITGFVISFIECPIDLIKTKMQIKIFNDGPATPSKSLVEIIRDKVKANGVRSLFQGLSATMVRNIPANALFIPTNELVKRKCAEREGVPVSDISILSRLLSGACAGLAYWVTTYPLDVVKATAQSLEYHDRMSWPNTVRYVYEHGGEPRKIKNFFRGFWPCAIRAIPACAAMFSTVDIVRAALVGGER